MWHVLEVSDLLSRLSKAEHSALDRACTDLASQASALESIASEVASEWRGGLRRVTSLDKRPRAIPSELDLHILADFRYRAFTRLPGMERLLDDRRVEEWKRAMAIRDALAKLSYEPPEEENAEEATSSAIPTPFIAVPEPRFLD